jgi:hypothetical protein
VVKLKAATLCLTIPPLFDVDCSGFVSYLLKTVGKRHYRMLAESTTDRRPLARHYYVFAAGLEPSIHQGWRRILRLPDTMPGDIVAWNLRDASTGDTGHVFVVAGDPVGLGSGKYLMPVYDSSLLRHFDDSRGAGRKFAQGVGSGQSGFVPMQSARRPRFNSTRRRRSIIRGSPLPVTSRFRPAEWGGPERRCETGAG